jgi:hypothetical protein
MARQVQLGVQAKVVLDVLEKRVGLREMTRWHSYRRVTHQCCVKYRLLGPFSGWRARHLPSRRCPSHAAVFWRLSSSLAFLQAGRRRVR